MDGERDGPTDRNVRKPHNVTGLWSVGWKNSYNFSVCLKIFPIKCWGNGNVDLCAFVWKGVHEIEEKFQNCRKHFFFFLVWLETRRKKKTGRIYNKRQERMFLEVTGYTELQVQHSSFSL